MAALLDCETQDTLEVVDASLAITASMVGATLSLNGVSIPVISAAWTSPASNYVRGVQFEYGPSDLSSGIILSAVQPKHNLSWASDLLVAGRSYTARYRAAGVESFGEWSSPVTILAPSNFVSTNTNAVGGQTAAQVVDAVTQVPLINLRTSYLEVGENLYPNLLPNSNAAQGLKYWAAPSGSPPNWGAGYDPVVGTYFYVGGAGALFFVSDLFPANPGVTYYPSWNAEVGGAGATGVVYWQAFDASGNFIAPDGLGIIGFSNEGWDTRGLGPSFVSPAGTASLRCVVAKQAGSSYLAITRIQISAGQHQPWRDDRTLQQTYARVVTEEAATAELRARPAPGGNLLGNTTFETLDGWTYYNYGLTAAAGAINLAGASYFPKPDNTLGSVSGAPGGSYADWVSDAVAVSPGSTIDFGAWTGHHRCETVIYIGVSLPDGSGEYYLDAGVSNNQALYSGGQSLSSFQRMWNKILVNPGYTRARLIMRHGGTLAGNSDSYAWFTRPYISEIPPGQVGPGPFSHGMPRWSMRAKWQVGVTIPGAEAFIQAVASNADGPATSSVSIGARSVAIYNPVGQDWKKALEVVSGNVILTGGLQAGAFIRLGSGQGWPVALRSVDFNLSDGEVCSFGTDLGAIPSLSFGLNNLAALGANETYSVYAENLTATGFTMRAKISVPATPSAQTVAGPGYAETIGGIGSGRTLYLEGRPLALDGSYVLTVSGSQSHRFFAGDTDDSEAIIELRLWAYNGVWNDLGTHYITSYYFNPGFAGSFTDNWSDTFNISFPSGTSYINAARVSSSNGRTGSLDSTGPVSWQAQGSGSGVRSATPSGEKTKVTVRPS